MLGVTLATLPSRHGTGPIYESPQCAGNETRVSECRANGAFMVHNYYDHDNDVAIQCHPTEAQG